MSEIFSPVGLAFLGAALAFAAWFWQTKISHDFQGIAIAHTYIATIEATQSSLKRVQEDPLFLAHAKGERPTWIDDDFRREDWFAVHHRLCGDLGKLVHLDRFGGPRAIQAVSSFFQNLKYAREVFAYTLALQKISSEADEALKARIEAEFKIRAEKIGQQIVELDEQATTAIKLLKKIS
ncbi:hypothetical protein [Pontivivens ytuae]|uniref:Uncharacterized protein n=1 Tax=Pontivivens ytuae TaxID=2789856 RepID=A0A7S9QBU8_9RHOB|nr:hypothetical protein [Pontivivens ytuae]QPH52717.1 hypothetical protein I0K15_12950 [Pontivivens ytuae]